MSLKNSQTIIACSRNLPAIAESDEDDNEDFYKNGVLFFGAVNYLTLDRFNRVLGRYSLRFGTAV